MHLIAWRRNCEKELIQKWAGIDFKYLRGLQNVVMEYRTTLNGTSADISVLAHIASHGHFVIHGISKSPNLVACV